MGITVGCMANSMHVLPIGSEAVSSGPTQWAMTTGQRTMTMGQWSVSSSSLDFGLKASRSHLFAVLVLVLQDALASI